AGQEIDVELEEGALLLEEGGFAEAAAALRGAGGRVEARLAPALDPQVADALSGPELARDLAASAPRPLWVDRERALVGAWYELFPRSEGGLAGTMRRLPATPE